jgi:hypothetical protein
MEVIVGNLLVWLILGVVLGSAFVVLQIKNIKDLHSGGFSTVQMVGTFICGLLSSVSFLLFLIAAIASIVKG